MPESRVDQLESKNNFSPQTRFDFEFTPSPIFIVASTWRRFLSAMNATG